MNHYTSEQAPAEPIDAEIVKPAEPEKITGARRQACRRESQRFRPKLRRFLMGNWDVTCDSVAAARACGRGVGDGASARVFGHRLVAHLGAVAEGAAQIRRLVVTPPALLIHMRLLHSDYVYLPAAARHTKHHNRGELTARRDQGLPLHPALLGPPCRSRDLVVALIISRVIRPASKLSTLSHWPDSTLGVDLGVAGACTDEIYAAMDWLAHRQDAIERTLAAKHLSPQANPHRMALFDLTSSWVTGRHCELAARGYSRDGKKGCEQIEYGVLTDPAGRPVAVRVVPGNTADPDAFTEIVGELPTTFGLTDLVLVGDRGMITKARIGMLRELNDDPDNPTDFGWITALRAPAIAKLAADDGPLQMSLFDTQDFAEITHPDYPDERLIACRNPALAQERARKRRDLLQATEKEYARIKDRVERGTLSGAAEIGKALGKVSGKYKVDKHFATTITDTSFTFARNQAAIDAEAALDGIYVLRTSVNAETLDAAGVVTGYKNLANVERDFRILKTDDLDLRPIYHRLDQRVRAHVLICLLACYLIWHLRKAWAPLT